MRSFINKSVLHNILLLCWKPIARNIFLSKWISFLLKKTFNKFSGTATTRNFHVLRIQNALLRKHIQAKVPRVHYCKANYIFCVIGPTSCRNWIWEFVAREVASGNENTFNSKIFGECTGKRLWHIFCHRNE